MTNKSTIQPLDKNKIQAQYNVNRPLYDRLAVNFQQTLKTFLSEQNISYLDITYRIKNFESAFEKIERKGYKSPFSEIEDWCGIRVICYYPNDVNRICEIIKREFHVREEEDKATRLNPHEFGYRSTHFVVQVNKAWLQAPNYRGLDNLKAEVQVRTILMHAWAEIEHKLAYKSAEQVPDKFRRKLYRPSAKFEEADEQFDELRAGLAEYRTQLRASAQKEGEFSKTIELNLDTLQAFLDYCFPDRRKDIDDTRDLLEEVQKLNLTMADVIDAHQKTVTILPEVEQHDRELSKTKLGSGPMWSQGGALRTVLDIGNDRYFAKRHAELGKYRDWVESTTKWRSIIRK